MADEGQRRTGIVVAALGLAGDQLEDGRVAFSKPQPGLQTQDRVRSGVDLVAARLIDADPGELKVVIVGVHRAGGREARELPGAVPAR